MKLSALIEHLTALKGACGEADVMIEMLDNNQYNRPTRHAVTRVELETLVSQESATTPACTITIKTGTSQ